jgi:putative peptidoglycan lipid II flippase
MLAATLVVAAATLLVYICTALKEIVVAHRFGTGDGLDSFLVAFGIPAFSVSVIATSVQPAFIPVYIRVKETSGEADAERLCDNVLLFLLLVLAAFSLALALCSNWLIRLVAPGFPASKLMLTRAMFIWLLPSIGLRGLAKTWSAVLNADHRFAVAALSPIGTPLIIITLALAAAGLGIYALVAGTLVGAITEATIVGWSLWRSGQFRMPRWHGVTQEFREVLRQYLPASSATFLMAAATVIDQWSASKLKPGSIAVLNYGTYAVIFLQQTASVALNTAVLPTFSRLAIARDYGGLRKSLIRLSGLALAATIPMTIALILLSRPLVSLLFQHGAFTTSDAVLVSHVQVFYCLQIPFYVLTVLVLRCLVAVSWNVVLFWGALTNTALKLSLNALFAPQLGVAGIALATSLMYMSSFLFHSFWLRRCIRPA